MTHRSVVHDTIEIERRFGAPVARVFAAWARPDLRRVWMIADEAWEVANIHDNFCVGGSGVAHFGPKGDAHLRCETHYLDIVDEERIIMSMRMLRSNVLISCSIVTVELNAANDVTDMKYTEQAAFLDSHDHPTKRRGGWRVNFDHLEAYLVSLSN